VSTAFRVILAIVAGAIVLALFLGPAWRGSFYRSWLRPRLVALGLLVVVLAAGEYLFRVINAIRSH
jgi:hypothetical protein